MMEIIHEPFVELTPEEIERGRPKIAKGYPSPDDRLTFAQEEWDDMYYSNQIAIPDDPHNITTRPGCRAESLHLYDPIYTPENPMPIDNTQIERWMQLGVLLDPEGKRPALDTANRLLHPRAPQMLTTIGMYTGPGSLRHHGPNPVGNFGLRLVRKGTVYYVTVAVDRDES